MYSAFPESGAQFPGRCFAPLRQTGGGDVSNHVCFCPGCAGRSRVCYGFYGVSPDGLLAYEPWGHVNHAGVACGCHTSDRMGAYVHAIASDCYDLLEPAELLSQLARSEWGDVLTGGTIFDVPDPASSVGVPSVRPGTVPFVSCRAGAYGRLVLATHERMMTGGLVACNWLRPVMRGRGVWLLESAS